MSFRWYNLLLQCRQIEPQSKHNISSLIVHSYTTIFLLVSNCSPVQVNVKRFSPLRLKCPKKSAPLWTRPFLTNQTGPFLGSGGVDLHLPSGQPMSSTAVDARVLTP